MILFEVNDISGRQIRLTLERWKHIARKHPEIHINEIIIVLTTPLIITLSEYDESVHYYFRFNKKHGSYLLVLVKYLNGEGFVISSYYSHRAVGLK